MESFWTGLMHNRILWVTIITWICAQGLKILIGLLYERKLNLNWLFRTGGMPSAHSAAVAALAVSSGKELGFSSPFFAVTCVYALIMMFDAQTWRRSVGVQAKILNKIMDDLHAKKKIHDSRLKEILGHTPIEVFVGALIGICMPLLIYQIRHW
jgi:uncharacterized protein